MKPAINVEVVYAQPTQQWRQTLTLPSGATVRDAIEQSGVVATIPEWNWSDVKVGIYSRPVALEQTLRDRDRVELYRPILIDPKEARRQRAKKK